MAGFGLRLGRQYHPAIAEEVIDDSQLLKELRRVFLRRAEDPLIAYGNQPDEDLPRRGVLAGGHEPFHDVGTVQGVLAILGAQVPEHRPDPDMLEELRGVGDDHRRPPLPVVVSHHALRCRRGGGA